MESSQRAGEDGQRLADLTTKTQALEWMELRVNRRVDRLERALELVISGAEKLAHTVIWLSAGALVLSVTVTQVVLDATATLSWSWLLATSWILFGIAVVLALRQMGTYMRIRSGVFRFEQKKPELRTYVDEIWKEENAAVQIEEKISDLAGSAWQDPLDAMRHHDVLAGYSGLSFIVALLSILIFAILNLP